MDGDSGQNTETQQAEGKTEQSGQGTGAGNKDTAGKDSPSQAGSGQQAENETVQVVQAAAEDGRIIVYDGTASGGGSGAGSGAPAYGGKIITGNVPGMADSGTTPKCSTMLEVGEGAVIVTVVCEEWKYTAGTVDTVAVANAVLTAEQIQLVNDGAIIEVRVDVKDISDSIPPQDMETVEKGYEEYGQYLTDLKLGGYVDISVYIKTGDSGWSAVTETGEPIEVVIGIPEELRGDGREYYVIRAHEGRHDLLNDMDEVPDTITVITDMFSSYAIAYRLTDVNAKCGLCHICPTFLGICCFIWLTVIIAAAAIVVVTVILIRKKETDKA